MDKNYVELWNNTCKDSILKKYYWFEELVKRKVEDLHEKLQTDVDDKHKHLYTKIPLNFIKLIESLPLELINVVLLDEFGELLVTKFIQLMCPTETLNKIESFHMTNDYDFSLIQKHKNDLSTDVFNAVISYFKDSTIDATPDYIDYIINRSEKHQFIAPLYSELYYKCKDIGEFGDENISYTKALIRNNRIYFISPDIIKDKIIKIPSKKPTIFIYDLFDYNVNETPDGITYEIVDKYYIQ